MNEEEKREKNRREFPDAAMFKDLFGAGVKISAARNAQGVTIGKVPASWAANDEPRDAA